jgi:hypothetical protein
MNHNQLKPNLLSTSLILILLLGMSTLPASASIRDSDLPSLHSAALQTARPIVVIQSYSPTDPIYPGQNFNLKIRLLNSGQQTATNVIATFTNGELMARDTGGVVSVGDIEPGGFKNFSQPLTATWDVWGKITTSISMLLTYSDAGGTTYTEDFTITFLVETPYGNTPTATPTVTPTPGASLRPQMVVTSYTTDPVILQPGTHFTLQLNVQNMGLGDAEQITLIVGGGSSSSGGADGTPGPGGTSSGGDFSNFAPLGSSNIQTLGDLPAGGSLTAEQSMIVNVTTNPGAYSMRLSFAYDNDKGVNFNDDQVITLLVYYPPVVEINFYRMPDPFFVGQPGTLPIQIINMGKSSAVFGNMRVNTSGAQLSNNIIFVGFLDPGGFFPMDASVIPDSPGTLELQVSVDYTDDFNQARIIEKTLTIDVLEGGAVGPGEGEGGIPPGEGVGPEGPITPTQPETFWQKIWRFIRGLFGLDSGQTTPEVPAGGEPVPTEIPGVKPEPRPPAKGF